VKIIVFSQVPSLAGCDDIVLKTSHISESRNSRTLLKGEVRTSLGFSQVAYRRGANIPHPTVHYSANSLIRFAGYTQVRWELPSG
jgi:hypothetical protein